MTLTEALAIAAFFNRERTDVGAPPGKARGEFDCMARLYSIAALVAGRRGRSFAVGPGTCSRFTAQIEVYLIGVLRNRPGR